MQFHAGLPPVVTHNSKRKPQSSWVRRQVLYLSCIAVMPCSGPAWWGRTVEQAPPSQTLLPYLSMRVCLAMSCSTVIFRSAPSKIVFLTTGATVRSKG